MKIFIDEQAWLAFIDPKLPDHAQFKRQLEHYLEGGHRFYTTNVIIGNVVSQLKRDSGSSSSIQFYNIVEEAWLGSYLHVLWIGRRTIKEAIKLFKRFTENKAGLFDFANVILMNRRNIRFIFTQSDFYSEMGFKILPKDAS